MYMMWNYSPWMVASAVSLRNIDHLACAAKIAWKMHPLSAQVDQEIDSYHPVKPSVCVLQLHLPHASTTQEGGQV